MTDEVGWEARIDHRVRPCEAIPAGVKPLSGAKGQRLLAAYNPANEPFTGVDQ